jgi:hypothetical protein
MRWTRVPTRTSAPRSPARKDPAGQPLPWIAIAITYPGLVALGVSEDSLQSFPGAFPGRDGGAGKPAPRLRREPAGREWGQSHRSQRLSATRKDLPPHHGVGAAAIRGIGLTMTRCSAQTAAEQRLHYAADPDGQQVPLGLHMRRMNSRDTKVALLVDVSSTAHGAPYDPNDGVPAAGMGQPTANFMSLGEERDPNIGLQDAGQFQRAARWRVLLHALPVGSEMARAPTPPGGTHFE